MHFGFKKFIEVKFYAPITTVINYTILIIN